MGEVISFLYHKMLKEKKELLEKLEREGMIELDPTSNINEEASKLLRLAKETAKQLNKDKDGT